MSRDICFTPYSWAKLCFIRDIGDTEIGCFGMAETDDPLLLTDIHLPEQECTLATVDLDGQSLLNYRAACRQAGLDEKHSFRVWIHTHPKMSANPSHTDETTYEQLFSGADWGVMLIVSKTGDEYARVRYGGDGPQADAELGIAIDYSVPFSKSNHADWEAIYRAAVSVKTYTNMSKTWKPGVKQKWVDGEWVDADPAKPSTTGRGGRLVNGVWIPNVGPAPTLATFPPAVGTGWQRDDGTPVVDTDEAEAEAADAETYTEYMARLDASYGTHNNTDDHSEYDFDAHGETAPPGKYKIRVLWCSGCSREYEVCDELDDDDGGLCQYCDSGETFEIHTYTATI